MKKILLIGIGLCIFFGIFSQTATYEEIITKKKRGRITEYITKTGDVYKIGDTLVLGPPFRNEFYDFIKLKTNTTTTLLRAESIGSDVIIKNMLVMFKTLIVILAPREEGIFSNRIEINHLEGAIEMGEIKKKGTLSSDEALTKLKKEKDKLDLGLITQNEYNKKKFELQKYIK